jgi:hypothetical protein
MLSKVARKALFNKQMGAARRAFAANIQISNSPSDVSQANVLSRDNKIYLDQTQMNKHFLDAR